MNVSQPAIPNKGTMPGFLKGFSLHDHKADIFLGANILDCVLTYIALQQGAQFQEVNSIMQALINLVGTGYALILKMLLCVVILWILRRINKEKLIMPLAVIFIIISLFNFTMLSFYGSW